MSAARDYHRATNVDADGTDEDEARTLETHPKPFKEYGDAERVPLESSAAGPMLRDGAGVVGTATHYGWPGERHIYSRAYSSAGALYPVEAYAVAPDGVYSFDALERALVPVRGGEDPRARLAAAAAAPELAQAGAVIVLTGIHARTGWKYGERGYRHIWWDAGTLVANLLALAAADELDPKLYLGFVDGEVNELLGVDGRHEYALALLAVGEELREIPPRDPPADDLPPEEGPRFTLAELLQEASALADPRAVEEWRSPQDARERSQDRGALTEAIRRRRSVREYAPEPLPRDAFLELLDWADEPIPADVPPVVTQYAGLAAVDGFEPGIYAVERGKLVPKRSVDEAELRRAMGYAAMDQDHPRMAAANLFQMADLDRVGALLGDRGYRWAQLEAGIRAGRIQIGAFMRGWGAAASTFFDDVVSGELGTDEAPLLMVALGARTR